ncbi:MAG TPA: hypothetical protein PKE64_11800 [Anaerolineae bacterium]|nr:hypothetical protein [Anaerolineae bacterium]HMR64684.1 hypothetical protein [Anaerolineae bacterium]
MGLICIGLLGLSGALLVIRNTRSAEEAAILATSLPPTPIPMTDTPTPTITPTATNTPEPTSTSTPVVVNQGQAAQSEPGPAEEDLVGPADEEQGLQLPTAESGGEPPTPIPTPVVSPTPGGEGVAVAPAPSGEIIPPSGGVIPEPERGFLVWLGAGIIGSLLLYGVVYRLRASL